MLADLHVHMLLSGADWRAAIAGHQPQPDEALIRQRLVAYRAAGITWLRDGGDRFGVCLRARELAAEYGITYCVPAFPIHRAGRYGGFIGRSWETMADYRALLDEAVASGADFIKLMISGLMDFSRFGVLTSQPLSKEELRVMVAAAHDRGLAVMAHCNGAETAIHAALAGVDSIEHGAYLDEAACHALVEHGVVWVPTLSTIGNLIGSGRYDDAVLRRILASAQENVRRVAALGGYVGLGSDAGAFCVPHVEGAMTELAWLHQTLGNGAEDILAAAEERVKKRFMRKK